MLTSLFHNYHAFDYTEGKPLYGFSKPKAFRDEIFENFMRELPCRLTELRKVIPQEIFMDFSYQSLEKIEYWYVRFIFQSYKSGVIRHTPSQEFDEWLHLHDYDIKSNMVSDTEIQSLFRLPREFRSLVFDLSIYLAETLRRTGISDIYWTIGHGKLNKVYGEDGAGHPRVYSKIVGGVTYASADKDHWIIIWCVLLNTLGLAREWGMDDDISHPLTSIFRHAFDLYPDDVIPEHLLYPKY